MPFLIGGPLEPSFYLQPFSRNLVPKHVNEHTNTMITHNNAPTNQQTQRITILLAKVITSTLIFKCTYSPGSPCPAITIYSYLSNSYSHAWHWHEFITHITIANMMRINRLKIAYQFLVCWPVNTRKQHNRVVTSVLLAQYIKKHNRVVTSVLLAQYIKKHNRVVTSVLLVQYIKTCKQLDQWILENNTTE